MDRNYTRKFVFSSILLVKYIFLLMLLSFITNCHCNCDSDCVGIACTEEFVTIIVTITDQDTSPFILNDYKVINLDNNTDITNDLNDFYQSFIGEGVYPIFDDRYQQEYQNQEVELQFIGYIDEQEVINEFYLVGADCCHVYPISGDYDITID